MAAALCFLSKFSPQAKITAVYIYNMQIQDHSKLVAIKLGVWAEAHA